MSRLLSKGELSKTTHPLIFYMHKRGDYFPRCVSSVIVKSKHFLKIHTNVVVGQVNCLDSNGLYYYDEIDKIRIGEMNNAT